MQLSDVKVGDRVYFYVQTCQELRVAVPARRVEGVVEVVVPHADVPYVSITGHWPHKTRDYVFIKADSGIGFSYLVEEVEKIT
jgi:hypothetical protein